MFYSSEWYSLALFGALPLSKHLMSENLMMLSHLKKPLVKLQLKTFDLIWKLFQAQSLFLT